LNNSTVEVPKIVLDVHTSRAKINVHSIGEMARHNKAREFKAKICDNNLSITIGKSDPRKLQICDFVGPQVQVFQSFFVSLNLPYSVVRGEEVALQVTVFNYELEEQLVSGIY